MSRRIAARPLAALAGASATLVAYAVLTTSPSQAQTPCGFPPFPNCPTTTTTESTTTTTVPPPQWDGSQWTGPTADGQTVADGNFTGTFVYAVSTSPIPTIEQTELDITYSPADAHGAACGDGTQHLTQSAAAPTSTTPTTEPDSSRMDFLFEVAFTCNGLYDATATATTSTGDTHDLKLKSLHIAVPPPSPLSLSATDNGNQTVTLTWERPTHAPVDTTGYRLSKRASSSQTFTPIADTAADATTYTDTAYPSGGGSFAYKVETLRSSPNGTVTSAPVVTDGALNVNGAGRGGASGGTVGGKARVDPNAAGPGTQYFDGTTLPGDEGESGAGDPFAAAGNGTVQRFGDAPGAGLVKPFAIALDLGVWAGLVLFLTRRAAREERVALRSVEFEHAP